MADQCHLFASQRWEISIVREPTRLISTNVGPAFRRIQRPTGRVVFAIRRTVVTSNIAILVQTVDLTFCLSKNSGGGSGQISQLVGLKREGNILRLAQTFAYGDRCNMSPSNAKLRGGSFSFDLTTTPYELVTLIAKNAALKDDDNLEDSAASCVALTHIRDENVVGVTLTEKDLQDQPGWTERFRYQSCFNAFYRKAVSSGQTDLTREELSAFTKGFLKACVTKAK